MSFVDVLTVVTTSCSVLVWFVTIGFLVTLHASLVVTQEAGLQRLPEKYPSATRSIEKYESRWHVLRAAVFLAAMLCLVGAAIYFTRFLSPHDPVYTWKALIVIPLTALGLSLVLEILPRVLSEGYADLFSVRFIHIAVFLSRILYPLAWPLAYLQQRLMDRTLSEADGDNRPSHEDEIRYLVDHASTEEIEEEERELLKSVFDFGDTITRESMTPRIEIDGIEETKTVTACCDVVTTSAHSRFPVYRETIDKIRGIVHVKDLLRLVLEGRGGIPVGDVAKPVIFVPATMLINDLLQLLQNEKEQLAIVVDNYGGTAGLITVEDIVEELVGDIHDEYDNEGLVMQRMPDGSTILDARLPVDKANKILSASIRENEDYDSLGGFVYHQLGRIPKPGEQFEVDGLTIAIQSADARRIVTVRVFKNSVTEEV